MEAVIAASMAPAHCSAKAATRRVRGRQPEFLRRAGLRSAEEARLTHLCPSTRARPERPWWVCATALRLRSARALRSKPDWRCARAFRTSTALYMFCVTRRSFKSMQRNSPDLATKRIPASACGRRGRYQTYFEQAYLARYLGFLLVEARTSRRATRPLHPHRFRLKRTKCCCAGSTRLLRSA